MAREGGSMEQLMNRVEFEEHHSRTWDYVARVGKIWEGIAEEQQAIRDGEGYKHLGYGTWDEYWSGQFGERTGWSSDTVLNWMRARKVKLSTPNVDVHVPLPTGPTAWTHLNRIEPEKRADFLKEYDEEIKPRLTEEGFDGIRAFREGIKDFKGERTVKDILGDGWDEDLPQPGLKPEQKVPTQLGSFHTFVYRLNPEAVVDAVQEMQTSPDLSGEIKTVDSLLAWLESYRDALVSRQATPLRAVKGGEK